MIVDEPHLPEGQTGDERVRYDRDDGRATPHVLRCDSEVRGFQALAVRLVVGWVGEDDRELAFGLQCLYRAVRDLMENCLCFLAAEFLDLVSPGLSTQ